MGLLNFFKNSKLKLEADDIQESGACPNCWGEQEWEGQFLEKVKDREKDILNKDRTAQKAFVQKFIEQEVTGIRLVNSGDQQQCPRCKKKYKRVSREAN